MDRREEQAENNLKIINQRNHGVRDGMIFRLLRLVDDEDDYGVLEYEAKYIKFLQKVLKESDIKYEKQIRFDNHGYLVDFDYFYMELFLRFSNKFQKQWVVSYPQEGQQELLYYDQLPWAVEDYEELITSYRIKQDVNLQKINYAFFILEKLYPKDKITNPLLLDLEDSLEGALIELNHWVAKFYEITYQDKIYVDFDGKVENLNVIIDILEYDYKLTGNLNTPMKNKLTEMKNLPPKKNDRQHNPFVSQFSLNDCKNKQQNFKKNLQFEGLLNNIDFEDKDSHIVFIKRSPFYKRLDGMTQTQIKYWTDEELWFEHQKEMMQREEMYFAELKRNGFYKPLGVDEKSQTLQNQNQDENRINQSQRKSNIFLNQSTFERSQFDQ